jgi:hypothetical protein
MAKLDAPGRTYLKEFAAAMLAYFVVLPASIVVIQHHPHVWWRFPVALAPVIPLLLLLRAIVRAFRRLDELQRRIQLDALAFAFAGSALLTFTYGLLENVGFPRLSYVYVWPVMGGLWGIGTFLAKRRYR